MNSNTSSLLKLSTELLVMIAKRLSSEKDISAYSQTCHRLYDACINHLYQHNSQLSRGSALTWAARQGRVDTLQRALSARVLIPYLDVMAEAAIAGQVNIFEWLFSIEGESLTQLPWDVTNDPSPVSLAAKHRHHDLLEYLCQIGFDVEYNGNEPIDLASKNGDYAAVQCLLKHGAGVTGAGQQHPPLFWAVRGNQVDLAGILLEHGSDVNYVYDKEQERTSLLHFALVCRSSKDMIELLVSYGANLSATDVYGATPFAFAVLRNHNDGAMVLLRNSSVDCSIPLYRGELPLHVAAHYGNTTMVKEFLLRGADAKARDPVTGWTALHFAASQRYQQSVDMVSTLIQHGVPLDEFDARGETPICVAVSKATDVVFKSFLHHHTDVNASVSTTGRNLLHEAARNGAMQKMRLLLERPDININYQDAVGRTALFHAARNRRINAMEELLLNGASPTIADKYGATPLFAAIRNGHEQETALLLPVTPDAASQRDSFGHTILWWAQKNGNPQVQDAILQYASNAETPIGVDDEAGPDILDISYDHIACYCDVCTRCVETHDWLGPAWQCSICHGGKFMICFDCALLRGESCPGGETHQANAWVEHDDCSIRKPEEYLPDRYWNV